MNAERIMTIICALMEKQLSFWVYTMTEWYRRLNTIRIRRHSETNQKKVNVKMIFSGTELKVEARDNITNQLYTTSFKFE
jgi:hypothetical protein